LNDKYNREKQRTTKSKRNTQGTNRTPAIKKTKKGDPTKAKKKRRISTTSGASKPTLYLSRLLPLNPLACHTTTHPSQKPWLWQW